MVVFIENRIFILDVFAYVILKNHIGASELYFYYKSDGSQYEYLHFSEKDHVNESKKVFELIKEIYQKHTVCYDIKDGNLIELK